MARSAKKTARKGPKADWVYRGGVYSAAGGLDVEGAGYAGGFRVLSEGSTVLILYDSQNFFHDGVGGDNNDESLHRSARADGRKAQTFRVRGHLNWEATTWAAGDNVYFGWRIGAFEQDATDGGILVPAGYTMLAGVSFGDAQPSVYANAAKLNAWEHRVRYHFASGNETSVRSMNINVPIRRTLMPNECLALYWELAPNSVGIQYASYLATLVSDEG